MPLDRVLLVQLRLSWGVNVWSVWLISLVILVVGPFVESEQNWALNRKILLYGPERPFTAQMFIKFVDEQINPAIQS